MLLTFYYLILLTGLRSSLYPTDQKEQQTFVFNLVGNFIKKVLNRETPYSIKIWTVESRRLARNSTDVLIPCVEVTFGESASVAIEFRKGASTRAKSKEKEFDGVYFGLFVGLQTRIRVAVCLMRYLVSFNKTTPLILHPNF
jgi:hypothetical protein